MLHLIPRRTSNVRYFLEDPALELEGPRLGPAGRFIVGRGDASREADVVRVLRGTSRSSVIGYDLIISAARPISALLAVGTDAQQRTLVSVHRDAVDQVMNYLQDRAMLIRYTENGRTYEESTRLSAAVAFTHGVNRAGDPHLHDHVLFGSASREFGRALDRRSLEAHLETADALYHAQLRDGLTRAGMPTWRDFHGRDYVAGVDSGLVALWPPHRHRDLPKVIWSRQGIVDHWQRQIHNRLDVPSPSPPLTRDVISEHTFAAHFEGRHSIGRRHIVMALANAIPYGVALPTAEILVSHYYPDLSEQRGVSEKTVSQHVARQTELVRAFGPRPFSLDHAISWSQRSRARDAVSRSR